MKRESEEFTSTSPSGNVHSAIVYTKGFCDRCERDDQPVLVVDTAMMEYGQMALCKVCILAMFAEAEQQ